MDIVLEAILTGLAGVVVALIGYLSNRVASWLKSKELDLELEDKGYLVSLAVEAVEQIWKNEDGAKKFEEAKKEAVQLLNDNGFSVTDAELNNFIEASVKAMNSGFDSVEETEQVEQDTQKKG